MKVSTQVIGAVVGMLAASTGRCLAQVPVSAAPARQIVYATPAPRYVVAQPARRPLFGPWRRYAYTPPIQQGVYVPGVRTYYTTPTSAFGRYRQAVDAGRDPNWATGRGIALYKPWEY